MRSKMMNDLGEAFDIMLTETLGRNSRENLAGDLEPSKYCSTESRCGKSQSEIPVILHQVKRDSPKENLWR